MVRGKIDEVTILTTGQEPAPAVVGDVLQVRGWIVPPNAAAWLQLRSGETYPLAVGDPRPDVVAAFAEPQGQYSGFRVQIPTTRLLTGTLEIALNAREGEAVRALDARAFELRVHRPIGGGDDAPGFVDTYVEESGVVHEVSGPLARVATDQVVTLRGWAADERMQRPVHGAVAFVGDHVVPALYGFERVDVISSLGLDGLRYCGFSVTFPGSYVGDEAPFALSLLADRGFVPTEASITLRAR